MPYSIVSLNTAKHLSLHDCICSRIYYEKNKLVLQMAWMDILCSHPKNPFAKAHQSGEGRIELVNPALRDIQFDESPIDHLNITEIAWERLEILDYDELEIQNGYEAHLFALIGNAPIHCLSLSIAYQGSIVMWNQLNGESWFEALKK